MAGVPCHRRAVLAMFGFFSIPRRAKLYAAGIAQLAQLLAHSQATLGNDRVHNVLLRMSQPGGRTFSGGFPRERDTITQARLMSPLDDFAAEMTQDGDDGSFVLVLTGLARNAGLTISVTLPGGHVFSRAARSAGLGGPTMQALATHRALERLLEG